MDKHEKSIVCVNPLDVNDTLSKLATLPLKIEVSVAKAPRLDSASVAAATNDLNFMEFALDQLINFNLNQMVGPGPDPVYSLFRLRG